MGVSYKCYKLYFVHRNLFIGNNISQLLIYYDMCNITNNSSTTLSKISYKYDQPYQDALYIYSFYNSYDTLYKNYIDEIPPNCLLFFIAWVW